MDITTAENCKLLPYMFSRQILQITLPCKPSRTPVMSLLDTGQVRIQEVCVRGGGQNI